MNQQQVQRNPTMDASFTTGQESSSMFMVNGEITLDELLLLRDKLIKQNEFLKQEVNQMEEEAERNELGYDDSVDGDFLKEIDDKI